MGYFLKYTWRNSLKKNTDAKGTVHGNYTPILNIHRKVFSFMQEMYLPGTQPLPCIHTHTHFDMGRVCMWPLHPSTHR